MFKSIVFRIRPLFQGLCTRHFFLLLVLTAIHALGQSPGKAQRSQIPEPCATTSYTNQLKKAFPELYDESGFEADIHTRISRMNSLRTGEELVYQIPVVVHVVSDGLDPIGYDSNISSKQVISQMVALNNDFRRRELGYNEHESGADIKIEFYLATHDPAGNLLKEPGIDRVIGEYQYFNRDHIEQTLKPATYWNPRRYLNIWVVGFSPFNGIAGYAQFPVRSGLEGLEEWEDALEQTDGVVINRLCFGTVGTAAAPYDLGRVTTHEIGHWLGLRHIWGDGGCDVDDYCEDTPPAYAANRQCTERTSCGSPDMIENYMDYTPGACKNIFTQDQKDRMRTVLTMSPRRKELIKARYTCQNATVVDQQGTFTTESIPQYFRYTSAQEEVLTISSLGLTSENTLVKIYDTCNGDLLTSSDDIGDSEQSFSTLSVSKDQEVIILWDDTHSAENFQWKLESFPLRQGATCSNAFPAQEGENSVTADQSWGWYTWVHEAENSKIALQAPGTTLDLFTGSCDQLLHRQSGTDSLVVKGLSPQDTCYVLVKGTLPEKWNLRTLPLDIGESCEVAREAINGLNQSVGKEHWSYFITPAVGDLLIYGQSNSVNPKVTEVYKACSAERVRISKNTGMHLWHLEKGETIWIKWTNLTDDSAFEWMIDFQERLDGQSCYTAFHAREGWNSHVTNEQQEAYWFQYVAPDYTSRLIFDFEEDAPVQRIDLYLDGGCENVEHYAYIGAYPWNRSPVIAPNDTIFLKIFTDGEPATLKWKITPSVMAGDRCEHPHVSYEGINESPAAYADCWTTFTMPRSGDLKISTVGQTDQDTYLKVHNLCTGEVIAYNDDLDINTLQSEISFDAVAAGTSWMFHWVKYYASEPFQWKISITENNRVGAFCQDAITTIAANGLKSSNGGTWYQLTVPQYGDLLITSQGHTTEDTYLKVYDRCDGALLAESDDLPSSILPNLQSELQLDNLQAGQELFIHWDGRWSQAPFEWKAMMTDTYEHPELNDQTFEIWENSLPASIVGTISASDSDDTPLLFAIIDGDEDGYFTLDSLSGVLLVSEHAVLDYESQNRYDLTVQVSNGRLSTQARITILLLNEMEAPLDADMELLRLYPNPVATSLFIELGHDQPASVKIMNVCGNTVRSFEMTGSDAIPLDALAPGVYLLQFECNNRVYHRKIIKR